MARTGLQNSALSLTEQFKLLEDLKMHLKAPSFQPTLEWSCYLWDKLASTYELIWANPSPL